MRKFLIVKYKDPDEIKFKYNDFMNRNKELVDKRNLRLQTKIEVLNKKMEKICTGVPKIGKKTESRIEKVRTPNEFFEDQVKFKEKQKNTIETLKQKRLDVAHKEVKEKPTISKVSSSNN